jgi:MFS family permease
VLILDGTAHIWQLAALQAIYGIADGFFTPAANGLVPQVVSAEDLQPANALLGLSENATSILGPAMAGVIVVVIGAGWGLAIDAVTFLVSASFLSALRVGAGVRDAQEQATSMLTELRAGWKGFSSRRWLLVSVGYFTLMFAFGFSTFQVLGPAVAEKYLGGPGAWAAISTAMGVGSIAGGVLALRWKPAHPLRVAFAFGLFGLPIMLLLLGAHAALGLIIVTALLEGVVGSFFNAIWFTAMQKNVPEEELSRVTSWDAVGSYALHPVGLALVGPLAATIGLPATLYGAGFIFLVITIGVVAMPSVWNFDGYDRERSSAGAGPPAAAAGATSATPGSEVQPPGST